MSSSKKEVSDAINEFTTLSHELVSSILAISEGKEYTSTAIDSRPNSSRYRDPELIMHEIIEVDQRLQSAVKKLQEEQNFYAQIETLNRKIKEKDNQINVVTNHLKTVQRKLQNLLDTAADNVTAINNSRCHPVEVDDLVVYGHRVSLTMGQSPFGIDQFESRFFRPPFPEDSSIQKTYLYTKVDILTKPEPSASTGADSGVGESSHPEAPSWYNEPSWYSTAVGAKQEPRLLGFDDLKNEREETATIPDGGSKASKGSGGLFDDLESDSESDS